MKNSAQLVKERLKKGKKGCSPFLLPLSFPVLSSPGSLVTPAALFPLKASPPPAAPYGERRRLGPRDGSGAGGNAF